jgi:GcrA cell cycle regulator
VSGWTDERVELLKQLVADGLSAAQCAARLGGFKHCADGGRSAVIGKTHRLGIAQSRSSYVSKPRRGAGKTKPRKLHRLSPDHAALAQMRREAFRAEPDLVVPENERRGLLDLQPGTCKWPIGDPKAPDFHFCNRMQIGTDSHARRGMHVYCEFHAARSSDGPAVRSRRPSAAPAPARQREDMETA